MRGKVFFNYRRSDSRPQTARLQEHLKRRLPRAEIFMDDNLEGGTDFIKELEGKAAGSDVFVSVIGPGWLSARGEDGKSRLEDAQDLVRNEIFWALQRGLPIVPVILDDTPMPSGAELPGEIKLLAFKQAMRLRDSHFKADARLIAKQIKSIIRGRRPSVIRRVATMAAIPLMLTFGAWAGPHVSMLVGIEPWVDIGVIKQYRKSNDFLRATGSHSFAGALSKARSEIWFVGTTFYISVDQNETVLFEKMKSGATLNFIVVDPRSDGLASSARALNTDENQLRESCLIGLRVMSRLKRRLAELGPEFADRLNIKLSRDALQMRAYFFDPLSPQGTTYVVPQINHSNSQGMPGYLVRHDHLELPGPYFTGVRDFWNSGHLVPFETWLSANKDV